MSMFLDQVTIDVKAGKGGDGMVAFRREKYVPDGGPAGGDGGRGGDVILVVDEGLRTLMDFRYNRHFRATPGENGMSKGMHGRGAEDTYVSVPPGTTVRDADTGALIGDLIENGQELIVAHGGRGGRGNTRFASPRNPAPELAENGEPGQERNIELELKVLADVGLVGFPSVGKSTILSVISSARPKIGAYHFTTLVPNLGMVTTSDGRSFAAADLPGLIEGASQGVGLGTQFLRHIERCRVIIHVVDMGANDGRDPVEDYRIINEELSNYEYRLMERPQIVIANKMDLENAEENLKRFKEAYPDVEVFETTTIIAEGLEPVLYRAADLLETTPQFPLFNDEDVDAEAEGVLYKFEPEQPAFEIHNLGNGQWELTGDELEKAFKMSKLDNDEAAKRGNLQNCK